MGIRFRIILIIIIVMSMISLGVYFLGDNVNTRIFRNIINENINTLGTYVVTINLHAKVVATLKIKLIKE